MLRSIILGAAAFGLSAGVVLGAAHDARAPDFANMKARLTQLTAIIAKSESCAAVEAAIDLTIGLVYGGTRPLPSVVPDSLDEARERFGGAIDQTDLDIAARSLKMGDGIAAAVRDVTGALEALAMGGRCSGLGGQAADVKFFLEEMEDVAAALGAVTRQCTIGDSLTDGPCAQLQRELDEATGGFHQPRDGEALALNYQVKLRSPFIPRYNRRWEEDVRLIPVLAQGECGSVFKETKGLMLRLRLAGFTLIRDPWATADLPRGTKIPIWTLEWVPSEYVKHFNICNPDGAIVQVTEFQLVKQDIPLNYFWRYYPKH